MNVVRMLRNRIDTTGVASEEGTCSSVTPCGRIYPPLGRIVRRVGGVIRY
jgi:hypothetical protein